MKNDLNNSFINGYNNISTNDVPFMNNAILMNNPMYYGSIRDSNFYQRINMERMERMKNIKSVNDLGLSKNKLTEYVICPLKIEKNNDSKEMLTLYDQKNQTYNNLNLNLKSKKCYEKNGIIYVDFDNKNNDYIQKLHSSRTNVPYKNILKNEDYTKEFKTIQDLIVHHITLKDKDKYELLKKYEELDEKLKRHNGELKIIFHTSKENEHKEKFDYVNYYKHKISYDPQKYDDLKKYYKKEQQKISKSNKRLENMIELLLENDLSQEELNEMQKNEIIDESETSIVSYEKNTEIEKELELDFERAMEKEFGKENLDKMIKEITDSNSNNNSSKPKRRVTVKTTKTDVGLVDDDELEKYKKKMKK